jgi:acetylornithine deacetylase/succinyl-diaminopimelate desuccinylase family protein
MSNHTRIYDDLVAALDERRLIASLKEMIAIRSENPLDGEPRAGYREKEMGEYLAERLTELGFAVTTREVAPGRPNVFGTLEGRGERAALMLAGHLDTAPADEYPAAYAVEVCDGKIYGRGSCDMKAGLAAFIETVRLLTIGGITLQGDLLVAGIVDEEYRMLGSLDVGRNGPHAGQGLIGEPTQLAVCPANKGQLGVIIRTFGRAAHSGVPETGQNAIYHMARVIDALEPYNTALMQAQPHPLCGHARFNAGVIRGGRMVSIVPDRCELEVDRRLLPGDAPEAVIAELRARLDPIADQVPGFRYELSEPTWNIPPNDVSPEEPVVRSLLLAHEAVLGVPTAVTAFPAGTDAPHMGFPTVVCGPGAVAQAHSTDEFVAVDQLVTAVRLYLWTVLDLLYGPS